jgi:hypothetical protein
VASSPSLHVARASNNDPVLKEQYEDLAVDFARNAGREQDLDIKISDPESDDTSSHSGE